MGRSVGEIYEGAVAICIREEPLEELLAFSEADMRRERGGFLIGSIIEEEVPVIEIRHFLPAVGTKQEAASLTFTHETWAHLNRTLDERFPEQRVLGWQHTHPGLGIFLSAYDLFIHRNFFSQLWQVALVVDPVRQEMGFFHWRNGDVNDCGFVVVEG
jgi:proteasome lid subunit RPN8/RPN11